MEKRAEILEKALVDGIIENAKLKEELKETEKTKKLFYDAYVEHKEITEKLESENKRLSQLVGELKTELSNIRGAEVKEICEVKEQRYSIEKTQ